MPSRAFFKYADALSTAQCLRRTAKDPRLRPIKMDKKGDYLHASLAAYVAGWDAYLNGVVREFVHRTRHSLNIDYATLHSQLTEFVEASLKRFNTPNWENSRDLLIGCTGYDPINDWNWPRALMSSTDTREYLNQILRVRHSFAHGFGIPAYSWTTTPLGKHRLSDTSLVRIERFFSHLVAVTDKGLSRHGKSHYPNRSVW